MHCRTPCMTASEGITAGNICRMVLKMDEEQRCVSLKSFFIINFCPIRVFGRAALFNPQWLHSIHLSVPLQLLFPSQFNTDVRSDQAWTKPQRANCIFSDYIREIRRVKEQKSGLKTGTLIALCVVPAGWSGRQYPKHVQPDGAGYRQPVHHFARQQGHQTAAARSVLDISELKWSFPCCTFSSIQSSFEGVSASIWIHFYTLSTWTTFSSSYVQLPPKFPPFPPLFVTSSPVSLSLYLGLRASPDMIQTAAVFKFWGYVTSNSLSVSSHSFKEQTAHIQPQI